MFISPICRCRTSLSAPSCPRCSRTVALAPSTRAYAAIPLARECVCRILILSLCLCVCVVGHQQNPKLLVQDMQTVQPTIFFGVPRVFNLLYDRVMSGVKEAGFIKRYMFNTAYHQKLNAIAQGTSCSACCLWDGLMQVVPRAVMHETRNRN